MSTADLTPTVVPVHGACVDASSWNGVIAELKATGLDVVAPPNPLRGVGVDAAYLTGFVEALGRPVVLVAHSYGGAVISQTGSDASNAAGLVYVAAYAPEAGETLGPSRPPGSHRGRAGNPRCRQSAVWPGVPPLVADWTGVVAGSPVTVSLLAGCGEARSGRGAPRRRSG
jgi:pimeloyl-ACP methyl ester carboxylesterase